MSMYIKNVTLNQNDPKHYTLHEGSLEILYPQKDGVPFKLRLTVNGEDKPYIERQFKSMSQFFDVVSSINPVADTLECQAPSNDIAFNNRLFVLSKKNGHRCEQWSELLELIDTMEAPPRKKRKKSIVILHILIHIHIMSARIYIILNTFNR